MREISENMVYFWLSQSGVGSKKLNAALSLCSAEEIYNRLPQDTVLSDFFGEKYTNILLKSRNPDLLAEKMDDISRQGISIIPQTDSRYPSPLKQNEVSPPPVLYCMGDIRCVSQPCIAIVGTRASSPYGRDVSRSFAQEIAAAGVTVVSGLATGIDSFAHDTAAGVGKTAAVLGGGHKHISAYSQSLCKKILDGGGAILSEYPPDFCPTRYSFPERNRIISGLSLAVVVIEAGKKSGALITVDFALEQGRGVYAVPDGIFSPKSLGCNTLIRDGGAQIALTAKDILSDLRINNNGEESKKTNISLDIFEQKIYNLLQSGKMDYDTLMTSCGFGAGQLAGLLFGLEVKGIIKRLPSNCYCLCEY